MNTSTNPTNQPSTDDLRDWDIDRLIFYVGELEAQVARLAKPQPEDTVTVTLSTEQAEEVVALLSDTIDFRRSVGDEYTAEELAAIHDEIVGALPKEDEAP